MLSNAEENRGVSLVEVLIVVALLGVTTMVVVPTFTPSAEKVLDVATNEVVQALRFAHSEAIRRGVKHGVVIDQSAQRVRLYWLDTSGATPTPVYDVRHPVDKKLYDFYVNSEAYPPRLSSVYIKYRSVALAQNFVGFLGRSGTPQYNDFGTIRMLETATIKLEYRGEERTISVTPGSGQVSVQ